MTSGRTPLDHADPAAAAAPAVVVPGTGPLGFLILTFGCGLLAGVLEVGAVVLHKRFLDSNHLYGMSRHFVWTVPLVDAVLFLALGIVLGAAILAWPVQGRRVAFRVIATFLVLPALLALVPRVHGIAWLIVALGVAIRVVPVLERRAERVRRLFVWGLPVVFVIVGGLAAYPFAADRYRGWKDASNVVPAAGSPNVILLVLDTVAADHLGLYGYTRPTSPTLDELASRGARFDAARATSSWTLPSHAGMFTGRWPHELSAGWLEPLDAARPTLAGYLAQQGYATAGFVANTLYCAWDSGLDRGFTTYRDFPLTASGALKAAVLVSRPIEGVQTAARWLDDWLGFPLVTPKARWLGSLLDADRKDAATVNRQFLRWLDHEKPSQRPFFAFLNYYDAHYPYQVPPTGIHRFGVAPRTAREAELTLNWWLIDKKNLAPSEIGFARDLYDDCVAHLDEQVGGLVDALELRNILRNTWLIVVADHGESFGEHEGVFCHGMSLYQTELHVPIVIVPPTSSQPGQIVSRTVSLRDLPTSIVEMLGLERGSTFPGTSLASLIKPVDAKVNRLQSLPQVLSEVVPNNPLDSDRTRLMVKPPPLVSLAEPGWSYIRREDSWSEELFHLENDPGESHDRSQDPAARRVLERMRDAISRLIGERPAPAIAGSGH